MASSSAGGRVFNDLAKQETSVIGNMMKSCYDIFDQDRDGVLDLNEFHSLTRALFCDENGSPYDMEMDKIEEIFDVFDVNKDGKIDYSEFKTCWTDWIKKILSPVTALLIIDIQNDFISGSLSLKNCPAAQDGGEVVPVTNSLVESIGFDVVVYSLDWHPADHISFYENLQSRKLHETSAILSHEAKMYDAVVFEGPPVTEQILWPAHCVQNSWGAEFHPDLKVITEGVLVHKGTNPCIDSYSAFWDNNKLSATKMLKTLQDSNVTDVYVCGLAYDFCVGYSANHALELGFRTILVEDACRGVNEVTIEETKKNILGKNGLIVNSNQVQAMVVAKDRRPELGYFAALQIRNKMKIN